MKWRPCFLLLAALAGMTPELRGQDTGALVFPGIRGSAAVLIDGDFRDSLHDRQLTLRNVTPGPREILVRATDGRQFRTRVVVPARGFEIVRVKFVDPPPPPRPQPERLASLGFSTVPSTLAVGDTFRTRLLPRGNRGTQLGLASLPAPAVTNLTPTLALGSVADDSLTVVALAPGSAQVRVRIGSVENTLRVQVRAPDPPPQPPPASLDSLAGGLELSLVGDSVLYLIPGEPGRLQVVARQPGGEAVVAPFRFASYAPEVALVDTLTGELTARAPGRATIRVRIPGTVIRQDFSVVVQEANIFLGDDTLYILAEIAETLRVTVGSREGRAYRGPVHWESDQGEIAEVNPQTGVLYGVKPGRTTVTAEFGGTVRSMAVQVFPRSESYLFMRSENDTIVLPIGDTLQLSAIGLDDNSSRTPVIPNAPVSWTMEGAPVASIQAGSGVLRGEREGIGTLVASPRIRKGVPPRTFRWPVRVLGGQIRLDRPRLGLWVGDIDTLRPLLVTGTGTAVLPGPQPEWKSSAPQVLRVGPTGRIEGLDLGRAVVTATTTWDSTASATVLVAPQLVYAFVRREADGRLIAGIRGQDMRSGKPLDVVSGGTLASAPAISPDRLRLAYVVKPPGGGSEIWIADVDGSGPARPPLGSDEQDLPVWGPGGTSLYYLKGVAGRGRIYRTTFDGQRPVAITDSATLVHSYAVSPDGATLVYSTTSGGQYDLYRLPLVQGKPAPGATAQVVHSDPKLSEQYPRFNGTGTELYFLRTVDATKGTKAVMRVGAQGAAERIGPGSSVVADLAVSADGTALIVQVIEPERAGRSRRNHLYLITLKAGVDPTPSLFDSLPDGDLSTPSFGR